MHSLPYQSDEASKPDDGINSRRHTQEPVKTQVFSKERISSEDVTIYNNMVASVDSYVYHTQSRLNIQDQGFPSMNGKSFEKPRIKSDLNNRVHMNKNFNNYIKP